ncbi:hypothetical protein [Haloarcula pellucida]|uniref:Uncharacterized protein n=1 Tax=Haloarcula pellucida TaxID=1427151 RepID=A0A830GI50_9EURY|nr:hypothetical protein [Halomicroarcula pellucida]MBX0346814.1 hypothetical protein [Halomicroarcula pellucida]GGN85622.1 hypothetical protein GCM10009030_02340 [Halomicroarcula pellucida]
MKGELKSLSRSNESGEEVNKESYSSQTRRNILKLVTSAGVSSTILTGVASAKNNTNRRKTSDGSNGASEQSNGNQNHPEWFTTGSENEVNHTVDSVATGVGIQQADGDDLDLGGSFDVAGVTFSWSFTHEAGTCDWDFCFTVFDQTTCAGKGNDCNTEVEYNFTAGVAELDATVEVDGLGAPHYAIYIVEVQGEACVYDPSYGYRCKQFSWQIDAEEAR